MNGMNLAQMLAERMRSPGGVAAFKDTSSLPSAVKYVQHGDATQMPGDDKQQSFPLDTGDADGGEEGDGHGGPGDGGLGMLQHAANADPGKHKKAIHKALEHAKSKHKKK